MVYYSDVNMDSQHGLEINLASASILSAGPPARNTDIILSNSGGLNANSRVTAVKPVTVASYRAGVGCRQVSTVA